MHDGVIVRTPSMVASHVDLFREELRTRQKRVLEVLAGGSQSMLAARDAWTSPSDTVRPCVMVQFASSDIMIVCL